MLYPTQECNDAKSLVCEDDGIRSRLVRNKLRLSMQLKTVTEALEALDKNPELANLLELVNKAR